jgi:phage tail-like protein
MRKRPVFERLPVRGYQDNTTADALTQYYDEKLVKVGTDIENLHLLLNPDTCPPQYLDWLAYMVGMVQPYYDKGWALPVKRKAVKWANTIFRLRGTSPGISQALSIHGFTYAIRLTDDLKLPFTFGTSTSRFGVKSSTAYITMPLTYPRNGYEFKEANRVVDNYSSVVNPLRPCYERFYFGFSVFNDPLL